MSWCGKHTRFLYEDVVEKDVVEKVDSADCCICLEALGNKNCCTTKCGHQFCLTCFVKYSKGDDGVKCPICRQSILTGLPIPEPVPVTDPVIPRHNAGLAALHLYINLRRDLALANNTEWENRWSE